MDIKRAKQEIKNTLRAYLSRDDTGAWRIPPVRQRPILLIGPPGIGKTQIMEQIAAETGVGLVSYTLTHHTRQSALGLPFIEQRTVDGVTRAVTAYTMSEILAAVYDCMARTGVREGILFLDEINCISETLAPMMLQFLQCKTFGNQPLPEGWLIVAAGNPPEYNKSVREFDVVTLDRVKRLTIKEDFAVFQQYARRQGLHGAILSYLELRQDHFYRMEPSAEGLQFVTARGWEDLSEMLYTYEALGLTADREVAEQYLQLPAVATGFADYLALYHKYREIYRTQDILSGTWPPVLAQTFAAAPFDEKLSVIGLLVARLDEMARAVWQADTVTGALHEDLRAIRDGESTLGTLLDARRETLAQKPQGGDRLARAASAQEVQRLTVFQQTLTLEKTPRGQAFDRLRTLFQQDIDARAAVADEMGAALEHTFAFLEQAAGEGQEMVLFAARLTAGFHTSWFIEQFGSPAYHRHNKALLFDDTHGRLLDEIRQTRAESES